MDGMGWGNKYHTHKYHTQSIRTIKKPTADKWRSLPRVINVKFPCSLTRNITSHRMESLAFHSLLRWKMIILYYQFSLTHLYLFSLNGWKNVLFELGSQRVKIRFHASLCVAQTQVAHNFNRFTRFCVPSHSLFNVGQAVPKQPTLKGRGVGGSFWKVVPTILATIAVLRRTYLLWCWASLCEENSGTRTPSRDRRLGNSSSLGMRSA